jgi:hypothetical protein
MANGRSDDFATKDIVKTVVCDVDSIPPEFEAENTTMSEPDGTIATITLGRWYIFPDGTVWEANTDGLKMRDDVGVCVPCGRPTIRWFWRRRPTNIIRSRNVLKACADCGQLLCRDHWVKFSADASKDPVYRCRSCAVRYRVKRLRQFVFFSRA